MNYYIFYYVLKWPQWFINNGTLLLVSCSHHYSEDWLPALASPPSPLDDPLRKFDSNSSSRWRNLLLLLLFFPLLVSEGCTLHTHWICALTIQGGSRTAGFGDPECSWGRRSLWGRGRPLTTASAADADRGQQKDCGTKRTFSNDTLSVHHPQVPSPVSLVHAIVVRRAEASPGRS